MCLACNKIQHGCRLYRSLARMACHSMHTLERRLKRFCRTSSYSSAPEIWPYMDWCAEVKKGNTRWLAIRKESTNLHTVSQSSGAHLFSMEVIMQVETQDAQDKCMSISPLEPGILMAQFYIRCALPVDSPQFSQPAIAPSQPAQHHILHNGAAFRLPTMVSLLEVPSSASMPMLISILSQAEEFSGICLRRGEKKSLNSINKNDATMRFFIPEASKPSKPKERIKTAAEKIFILVCMPSQ